MLDSKEISVVLSRMKPKKPFSTIAESIAAAESASIAHSLGLMGRNKVSDIAQQFAEAQLTARERAMLSTRLSSVDEVLKLSSTASLTSGLAQHLTSKPTITSFFSGLDPINSASRIASWQSQFAGLDRSIVEAIAPKQNQVQDALADLIKGLGSSQIGLKDHRISDRFSQLGLDSATLELTSKRFAALAGVGDLYGYGSLQRQTAETLLGQWRTNFSLPSTYWTDFQARHDLYREAEVDSGLIEADPSTAVEVAISSGAILGEIVKDGHYVVAETASGIITLTTQNIANDVFGLIGTVEKALRELVSRKLEARAGDKWFKQHVSGEMATRAKQTRAKALKAGEANAPLIEFLTLGELMEVVLRADNWTQVFEPIFRNRDWFRRDVEIITVARNPNAHYRANDTVRFIEALLVWKRLHQCIEDDGRWLENAEADE